MNILRSAAGALAVVLLAGCGAVGGHGSAGGEVTGKLLMEGGPLGPGGQQPGTRSIPGVVTFSAAGHRSVSVRVANSGAFTVNLPPGRYRVTGKSPRIIQVGNGTRRELPCSQLLTVTVTAHHTATIAVTCIVP
jgi:hypothetical protein